ncbi:MAG TPA: hypothetical protein VHA30_02500 [Patescibacteria group bacterium]|nr:hypothetical protein [Patescibacteria group bacterium]
MTVSMAAGTVVLPCLDEKTAYYAFRAVADAYLDWLNKKSVTPTVFGISLRRGDLDGEFEPKLFKAGRSWHLISAKRPRPVSIDPTFVLLPISGQVVESHFHYWQIAKIPQMTPHAVLRSLQTQDTDLAGLEGPLIAVYGWTPYRKGALLSLSALKRRPRC